MKEKGDIIGGTLVEGEILGGVRVDEVIERDGITTIKLAPKYEGAVEPGSVAALNAIKAFVAERDALKVSRREKRDLKSETDELAEPVASEELFEESDF